MFGIRKHCLSMYDVFPKKTCHVPLSGTQGYTFYHHPQIKLALPYIVFLAHIYRKSRMKSPFSYVGTILSAHQRFLQNCFIERASIAMSCKEEKL